MLLWFAATATTTGAPAQFQTSYTYRGAGAATRPLKIVGFEPRPEQTTASAPVFIWLTGRDGTTGSPADMELAWSMSRRGFIAASVEYPDTANGAANGDFWETLQSVHSEAAAVVPAALDILCARALANCSVGVALSGYDQGGWITFAAITQEPRLTAVLPLAFIFSASLLSSAASIRSPVFDWFDARYSDAALSAHLARSKRRLMVGAEDDQLELTIGAYSLMSGYPCVSQDCLQADGSGAYGLAGAPHNFLADCEPMSSDGLTGVALKCAWRELGGPGGLRASFDWLANAAAPSNTGASGGTPADAFPRGCPHPAGDVPLGVTLSQQTDPAECAARHVSLAATGWVVSPPPSLPPPSWPPPSAPPPPPSPPQGPLPMSAVVAIAIGTALGCLLLLRILYRANRTCGLSRWATAKVHAAYLAAVAIDGSSTSADAGAASSAAGAGSAADAGAGAFRSRVPHIEEPTSLQPIPALWIDETKAAREAEAVELAARRCRVQMEERVDTAPGVPATED